MKSQTSHVEGFYSDQFLTLSTFAGSSTNDSALERGKASTALRSVRHLPQTVGPFLTLFLTLCCQGPGPNSGKRDGSVLPEGALFVVRYSSE